MEEVYHKPFIRTIILGVFLFGFLGTMQAQPNQKDNTKKETVTKEEALADLNQLKELLDKESAFAELDRVDYEKAITKLKNKIQKQKGPVQKMLLAHEMAKIVGKLGDRHAYVKYEGLTPHHVKGKKNLPGILVWTPNGIVWLKKTPTKGEYNYYHEGFPFLTHINGVAVKDLIKKYHVKDAKAPKAVKGVNGAKILNKIGFHRFFNGESVEDVYTVRLENKQGESKEVPINATNKKVAAHNPKPRRQVKRLIEDFNQVRVKKLFTKLDGNIGYLRIPKMVEFGWKANIFQEQFDALFKNKIQGTDALIIDLRYNRGGKRDVLELLSDYILPPDQSPKVVNVVYPKKTAEDNNESLDRKKIYLADSPQWSNEDKQAITQFENIFTPKVQIPENIFGPPRYYIIRSRPEVYYRQPVYILISEETFSAASVFASAFKGMSNVHLVGTKPDSSSGNSKEYTLKHSGLLVKLSRALSFQQDGNLFDGVGTKPDIRVPNNERSVLGQNDRQKERAVKDALDPAKN